MPPAVVSDDDLRRLVRCLKGAIDDEFAAA
jgi:hypothetical protein